MPKGKHTYFFLLLVATILVDQGTKSLIVERFALGEVLGIIPGLFNLTYIRNTGVAFGMFAGGGELTRLLLLILPVLVAFGLLVFYLRLAKNEILSRAAVCLILGGAISNLIDRFRLGYVIDFLDFHWKGTAHYPSFNAADAFICTGVFILFLTVTAAEKKNTVPNV